MDDSRKLSSPSPYDAPELYDRLFDSLDFDLAYWLRTARAARGPVLEVACGTGRVLLALRRAGLDAEGFDASPAMIGRLRDKAAKEGLAVRAEIADMRDFEMGRLYRRVFCAFNGFAHFDTPADQIACLRACHRHLEPGGALIVHMSYPGPAYWSETSEEPVLELEVLLGDGGRLQLWDSRRKDPVHQRQRSSMEIREIGPAGKAKAVHRFSTSQRWVYRYELELLFAAAGFARSEFFGGFDGRPLLSPEDQMVAWAYKAASGRG
jgi:SAM-dependent methyltransferase